MAPIKLLKKTGPPCIADKPDSFEGLVNGSTIVVDKSPFISHVFEAMRSEGKSCIYVPLTPNMGKTCLLSMLKSFVDVSFRGREDPEDVFATKFDEGLVLFFCSLATNLAKHFHFFCCTYRQFNQFLKIIELSKNSNFWIKIGENRQLADLFCSHPIAYIDLQRPFL